LQTLHSTIFVDQKQKVGFEDFLNQMHANKMEGEYFADNLVIYIEKS